MNLKGRTNKGLGQGVNDERSRAGQQLGNATQPSRRVRPSHQEE